MKYNNPVSTQKILKAKKMMDENDASILNFSTNKANMKPISPMLMDSSRVRKAELKRLNTR